MYKKGSMELSVNSIVILVIAVVMMGLILGFIKTKFSDISKDAFNENEPDAPEASSSEPITLSRYAITASPGKKESLKINFFNTNSSTLKNATPVFQCKGGISITWDFFEKDVPSTTQALYKGTIKTNNVNKDTYLCKVCIVGYTSTTAPSSSRPTSCNPTTGWYVSESREFTMTVK